jgi:hypothetical protein
MADAVSAQQLAAYARQRAEDAADAVLGDRLRASGDGPVRFVSVHSLLQRCPLRAANPADDYEDTVGNARRRVGLAGLRHAESMWASGSISADPTPDLAAAVAEAMRDRAEWSHSLREWVETLSLPGRAAVHAAATTWAVDAARLVGTDQPRPADRPRPKWCDPFRQPAWRIPGRRIRVGATVDAVMGTPSSGSERLLVITDATPGPGDTIRAGHVALVRSLTSGRAPERVSLGSPATGEIRRFGVDRALLELAVDRLSEFLQLLENPADQPAVPGRWCHHCHLLDLCQAGAAHLSPDVSTLTTAP